MSKSLSSESQELRDKVAAALRDAPERRPAIFDLLEEVEALPPQKAIDILLLNQRIEIVVRQAERDKNDIDSAASRLRSTRARAVAEPPGF